MNRLATRLVGVCVLAMAPTVFGQVKVDGPQAPAQPVVVPMPSRVVPMGMGFPPGMIRVGLARWGDDGRVRLRQALDTLPASDAVMEIPADQVRVFRADGQPVGDDQAAALFGTDAPVCIESGQELAPAYTRAILKPDTPVLLVPLGLPTAIAPRKDGAAAPPSARELAWATAKVDGGHLVLRLYHEYTIEVDGQKPPEPGTPADSGTPTKYRVRSTTSTWEDYDAADVQARELDGSPIAADDARRRLTAERPVLKSTSNDPLDPTLLTMLRPKLLVLVTPRFAFGLAPQGFPAPVAPTRPVIPTPAPASAPAPEPAPAPAGRPR